MAFTDALIDHANVRVALVDRRHGASGHWLEAYPFVRLHQASAFYGVPSTRLGGAQLQQRGPEAGLQERSTQSEICTYYARILERMEAIRYNGWVGIEYVWIDWEQCNRCDNLSETILFRDFVRRNSG